MRYSIAAALAVSLLLSSEHVAALDITLDRGSCGSAVHLVAKGVRLSEVLKELSRKLDFQLQYETRNDPVISIDISQAAPQLVAKLAAGDNVIVTQSLDPKCPRQYRISKVWVLPKANESVAGATGQGRSGSAPAAARSAATSQNVTPPAAPQWAPSQLDEMSKARKAAYDAYVKEHGEPPPPAQD